MNSQVCVDAGLVIKLGLPETPHQIAGSSKFACQSLREGNKAGTACRP